MGPGRRARSAGLAEWTVTGELLSRHRVSQEQAAGGGKISYVRTATATPGKAARRGTARLLPASAHPGNVGVRLGPNQSGEILLQGPDSKLAVEALLASPVHKQLLLHSHFRLAGLGAIRDGSHWLYCLLLADQIPVPAEAP